MIIENRSKLIKLISNEKEKGKRIVAVCGCFEVFHIGHLEYLIGAKELGDILLVGMNADSYIINRKQRKPRFSLTDRMRIINHVDVVDYVFAFSEDTFDVSLQEMCPDVFAKGIDRDYVVEKPTCDRYGISVVKIGKEKRGNASILRNQIEE